MPTIKAINANLELEKLEKLDIFKHCRLANTQ